MWTDRTLERDENTNRSSSQSYFTYIRVWTDRTLERDENIAVLLLAVKPVPLVWTDRTLERDENFNSWTVYNVDYAVWTDRTLERDENTIKPTEETDLLIGVNWPDFGTGWKLKGNLVSSFLLLVWTDRTLERDENISSLELLSNTLRVGVNWPDFGTGWKLKFWGKRAVRLFGCELTGLWNGMKTLYQNHLKIHR